MDELTQEEVDALLAEKKAWVKEKEEMVAKLKGFEDKDLNFQKLRHKKEEDISDEKKQELKSIEDRVAEMEANLNKKHQAFVEAQFETARTKKLESLAGEDTELKEKIEFHYARLTDETSTPEAVAKKLEDAYILATGMAPKVSPIHSTTPMTGSFGSFRMEKTNFVKSDRGAEMLKYMFPNLPE